MLRGFGVSRAGECDAFAGVAAEGATGPRKRSGKKDRVGKKSLWKAGRVAAPTE